jgi:hypothetical protein
MQQQDIPYGLYREEFTSLSHGLALWNPNPSKHSHDNVSIGDVGFIRLGTFVRMFNVMLPWDDESNKTLGDPGRFKSLDCGPSANITESPLVEKEHHSRHVKATNASKSSPGVMIEYNCPARGALLYLPLGGLHKDAVCKGPFEDYIRDNVESWFSWAQEKKLDVERMEDIILVTGCTLAISWAVAAFVETKPAAISLESTAFDDKASFVWAKKSGSSIHRNSCPVRFSGYVYLAYTKFVFLFEGKSIQTVYLRQGLPSKAHFGPSRPTT